MSPHFGLRKTNVLNVLHADGTIYCSVVLEKGHEHDFSRTIL